MRAAVLHSFDSPPQAGEFDDPPAPEPGSLLVEVHAAGLNPIDLRVARGGYPGRVPPLPSVVGSEGVGTVVSAPGSDGPQEGERIYFDRAVAPYGSIAELALVDAGSAIPLPDALEDAAACAIGIAGLAAWLALEWQAGLQPGETALVLGASGVVGQVGVQAAKLLGASRVIAAARSPEGLRRAAALGADATVSLADVDLEAALAEAAGSDGVDVVLDPLWGEPLVAALSVVARGARVVHVGQSAGDVAAIPALAIRPKGVKLIAHTNFLAPHDVKTAAYARMARHAAAGELRVDSERVPLEDIAAAWERQATGPGCKLIVVP